LNEKLLATISANNNSDIIQILIVDDELQSRALIKKLLAIYFPHFAIDEAENVPGAIKKVHHSLPQIVFLDVQMQNETGFDLLDKINPINFEIIFTTAHSKFAVKALRYSALDYLLKPIDIEEFKTAVEKAVQRIKNKFSPAAQIEFVKEIKAEKKSPDKLVIPTAEGFLFISVNDILYCRAAGNYTEFHLCNNQKSLSGYTLGYYDELLGDHNFFRVHRSYLINMAHIRIYKRGDGGTIIMNDGEKIEVSRNNKETFLKMLKL